MSKAPERIWAWYEAEIGDAVWAREDCTDVFEFHTPYGEYIRADLVDQIKAQVRKETLEEVKVHLTECIHLTAEMANNCPVCNPTPSQQNWEAAKKALHKIQNERCSNFDKGAVVAWAEKGYYQMKDKP